MFKLSHPLVKIIDRPYGLAKLRSRDNTIHIPNKGIQDINEIWQILITQFDNSDFIILWYYNDHDHDHWSRRQPILGPNLKLRIIEDVQNLGWEYHNGELYHLTKKQAHDLYKKHNLLNNGFGVLVNCKNKEQCILIKLLFNL